MVARDEGEKSRLIWRSKLLSEVRGVIHGVSTRLGGVSLPPFATLNLGLHTGDRADDVIENRRRFLERLGVALDVSIWAEQVHGAGVARVSGESAGRGARLYDDSIPGVDALVTTDPGLVLAANFADCVPILIASRDGRGVAIAHAGWRGTIAGVGPKSVEALEALGIAPRDLVVALGPSIQECCYQVSQELFDRFSKEIGSEAVGRTRSGRPALALSRANRKLLIGAGVASEAIEISSYCTACRTDLFFSHRAEKGVTGRIAAAIGVVNR